MEDAKGFILTWISFLTLLTTGAISAIPAWGPVVARMPWNTCHPTCAGPLGQWGPLRGVLAMTGQG